MSEILLNPKSVKDKHAYWWVWPLAVIIAIFIFLGWYFSEHGQKQKMRTLFEIGGPRHSILLSKGLDVPAIAELPLPDSPPQWLQIKIFPNPATSQLTINMEYDERWVGKQLQVIDITGKIQIVKTITSKVQKLDISQLAPGVYFLKSEKTGEKMMQKFIKL